MNRAFRKRFEEGLKAAAAALTKKGGTKKYEAVVGRIARLEGRYPSIEGQPLRGTPVPSTRHSIVSRPLPSSGCSHTGSSTSYATR